jgi:hypothetical protein
VPGGGSRRYRDPIALHNEDGAMRHFLSGLFGKLTEEGAGRLPAALIDAAIERAVDGTDRRLRALGKYRKRLRVPVTKAVQHVIQLIDELPPAVEISPGHYGTDRRLRAVFVSADHLNDTLTRFWTVRDYLSGAVRPLPDDIFGLLTMTQREHSVLGMELDGEMLKRDVLQTAVSFGNHQFLAPAATERRTRRELKRRAYDFLVRRAQEQMLATKTGRGDLVRQRHLLRARHEALHSGQSRHASVEDIMGQPGSGAAALEAEIAAIDAELGRYGKMELGLEESLRRMEDILAQPETWLTARPLQLNLDYRGIKLNGEEPGSTEPVEMTELSSAKGTRRIVLLGRIPRVRFPQQTDVIRRGQAYLG